MELLITSLEDPAGVNMAQALCGTKVTKGPPIKCEGFELMAISGPVIEADSIEDELDTSYDGIAFLSRHAAVSGRLALTCHSTGNFGKAQAGGRDSEVAVPHSQLIKRHIRGLWDHRAEFGGFDITLEATHHGPTALRTPSVFIEVGTTDAQWRDASLCAQVAQILCSALLNRGKSYPTAVCFGGNHYPSKFTQEAISGEFATGTIVPKHSLEYVDEKMFSHILAQNPDAQVALVDSKGMGLQKSRILDILNDSKLEVIKL